MIRSQAFMMAFMTCSIMKRVIPISSRIRWTRSTASSISLSVEPGKYLIQQKELRTDAERPGDLQPFPVGKLQ